MIHHSKRTIELDPTAAIALRDWLVTLSQRLGLDAGAAADAPTPPTSVAPDEIAPYLGELAFLLDASGCPDPETASVRITIASEPAVDSDHDDLVESQLNVLDDRIGASETLSGLDDPCSYSYFPDTGVHGDADPDYDDVSIPSRGYYVDPEYDARDYDLGIHAPLEDALWTATQCGLLDPRRGPHMQRVKTRTQIRLHPEMSPLTLTARADWIAERTAIALPSGSIPRGLTRDGCGSDRTTETQGVGGRKSDPNDYHPLDEPAPGAYRTG